MAAKCKGNKDGLDKDLGHWEGTTYCEKPLDDAEEKLAKTHWKN